MEKDDIELDRGDDDIVFVSLDDDIDTTEIIEEAEKPRERLENELSREKLEWENAKIAAIFRDEISLHLEEDAEIRFGGEQVYPERGDED